MQTKGDHFSMARTKTTQSKKRNVSLLHKRVSDHFSPGAMVEALMSDDRWPHYIDVYHPVKVISPPLGGQQLCRCIAFNKGRLDYSFDAPRLFRVAAGKNWVCDDFEVGETVNILLKDRKVDGVENVDGLLENGVWVRAKLVSIDFEKSLFLVCHRNWSEPDKTQMSVATLQNIRKDPLPEFPLSLK